MSLQRELRLLLGRKGIKNQRIGTSLRSIRFSFIPGYPIGNKTPHFRTHSTALRHIFTTKRAQQPPSTPSRARLTILLCPNALWRAHFGIILCQASHQKSLPSLPLESFFCQTVFLTRVVGIVWIKFLYKSFFYGRPQMIFQEIFSVLKFQKRHHFFN